MEIKRDFYLNQLISSRNDGLIKIITGIRRCGKSYLLDPIFKDYLLSQGVDQLHIIKVELDSIENQYLLDPQELNNYIKSKIIDENMYYVLLDEIQKVENFESVLNGLLRIKNIDIYVTGSNSKFLSSDIVTEFRGRGEEIRVFPLSFSEYYSVDNKDKSEAWNNYITYGGLPLILSRDTVERKAAYLETQANNVYINDVVERNKIQNVEELNALIRIVSSGIGSLTNPTILANTFNSKIKLNISDKTISNYLAYLQEAFIIEKAERYDIKGKQYIGTPSKYYFSDIGIRNTLVNFRQPEESHIMENIIYNELRRRGYEVNVGVIETREKENGSLVRKNLEVDFIANKGNDKIYIQSALNIDSESKKEQEERSLLKIKDNFKKFIIRKDNLKAYRDENGIIIMGIFDFLLDDNSLIM